MLSRWRWGQPGLRYLAVSVAVLALASVLLAAPKARADKHFDGALPHRLQGTYGQSAANASAMAITGISPAGAYNYRPTKVTITGSGFSGPLTLRLGDAVLTDVGLLNASTLVATVPAYLPAGTYGLIAEKPNGEISLLARRLRLS